MKHLAFNSLVLILGNFSTAALGFGLSVLIGRALGVQGFGQYTLALAWALALSLFADLGLDTLLTRDLARQRGETARYLKASALLKTVVSLGLILLLVLGAPLSSSDAATVTAIRLAAPLVYFNALYTSFTAIFRAFQRMIPILLLGAGGLSVQIGGAWWLIAHGGRAPELILLAVGVQGVQVVLAFLTFRLWFRPPPSDAALDRAFFRRLGGAALPFAIAGLLGAAQLRVNVLLMGTLMDTRAVGLFGAASRWSEAAKMVPSGFFGALFPALSAQARDHAQLERSFQRAERVLLLFGLAAALVLTAAAHSLIALTYGAAFAAAAPALQILSWAIMPWLWNGVMGLYLYVLDDEGFVNWISTGGLVVLCLVGVAAMARLGVVGVALAALASELSMALLYRWRCTQLRRRQVTWKTLGSTD